METFKAKERQQKTKEDYKKKLYENTRSYILVFNMQSEMFKIKEVLGQCGFLNPLLFIMWMDDILKFIDKEKYKVNRGFYKVGLGGLAQCAFADDLTNGM